MEHITNQITLRGTLCAAPQFSHENHGRKFYKFFLSIPRLSGTLDTLPVIAEDSVLEAMDPSGGDMIRVVGQIRSHNIRSENKRHLLIFVFASFIQAEDGEPVNEVILEGPICRDPIFRRTPLGREICDIMLAVPRAFRKADYLPCILWGRTAQEASQCHTRDRVRIYGRLQSRSYTKITEEGIHERIAYEISALSADMPEDIF